jgi:hypothetical protein
MRPVDTRRTPDRNADGVNGDRIVLCDLVQQFGGMGVGEKVFGVNFKPRHGRAISHDFGEVLEPKPDTRKARI